jgi:hydrogenase/urease accessory protein HupE
MRGAATTILATLAQFAALLWGAALFDPPAARAHLGNISYADFDVRGHSVLLRFKFAAHLTPGLPPGQEAPASRAQLLSLKKGVASWIDETVVVQTEGERCTPAIDSLVGPDSNDDLVVTCLWTCKVAEVRGLRLQFRALSAILDDWQTIASMRLGGETFSTVFTPDGTRWLVGDVDAATAAPGGAKAEAQDAGDAGSDPRQAEEHRGETASDSGSFSRFFALGVEHIWTGYDHLLFLFAVLLAGGGLARLAAIVTSFTVAHSITLGAAATGLVHLPVAPVEAVIALSIVYVAVENILGRGADRRALVTFGFGLIHGFGFASVLAETALPAGEVVIPLLAFNLGVEAGQLAVLLAVLPLLAMMQRGPRANAVKVALSALIALCGAAWAFERLAAIFA